MKVSGLHHNFLFLYCCVKVRKTAKKSYKDQESIQSSTTPGHDTTREGDKNTIKLHK